MTPNKLKNIEDGPKRAFLFGLGLGVLIMIYLFQRINYIHEISSLLGLSIDAIESKMVYSMNKTIRYILNDVMTIIIIYAIFYKRKYVIFSIYVQLFGLIILLPIYLIAKWHYPSYNGPLINYLHRLTLNPVLLMLLVPVFIFQKNLSNK